MKTAPQEMLKECVKSQHFTSTAEIMTAMKEMFRDVVQTVMEVELDEELGRERCQRAEASETTPNYRNGYSKKTVKTQLGEVDIKVPRDRKGMFDPKIIGKYSRNADGRVFLVEGGENLRQHLSRGGFPAADGDDAGELLALGEELLLGLVRQLHQLHQLLRSAAQQHPLLGEGDSPAAGKELGPQLLLQLSQLPVEGRLGDMQYFRRTGDVFLPDHGKKIAQDPKFHGLPPCGWSSLSPPVQN